MLIEQLFNTVPGLKRMLIEPEDDGEERFVDALEEGQVAKTAAIVETNEKADDLYDGKKREPLYAKAETSCLWEIVSFFHVVSSQARSFGGTDSSASLDPALPPLNLPSIFAAPPLRATVWIARHWPEHPDFIPRQIRLP
jgi:hypothetical protein